MTSVNLNARQHDCNVEAIHWPCKLERGDCWLGRSTHASDHSRSALLIVGAKEPVGVFGCVVVFFCICYNKVACSLACLVNKE